MCLTRTARGGAEALEDVERRLAPQPRHRKQNACANTPPVRPALAEQSARYQRGGILISTLEAYVFVEKKLHAQWEAGEPAPNVGAQSHNFFCISGELCESAICRQ